jgi:hypothetical protein
MNQTIKIDQLADTVMKGMEDYAKLVVDDLKADVQKAGKTVKQQIESTAPKKTGKYSKSWAIKKTRETSDSIQIVVHSKRYQLTIFWSSAMRRGAAEGRGLFCISLLRNRRVSSS